MSLPSIQISSRDHTELIMMIARLRARVTGLLISEIQRAEVESVVPPDVVGMGSTVTYSLDGGPEETLVLTYPENAGRGKVSVSSPLGAALLGLRQGDAFAFRVGGKVRRIRVMAVTPCPETSADGENAQNRPGPFSLSRLLRAGRERRAARTKAPSVGHTAPWRNDRALRLLCLLAIIVTFAALFFRYRLLAWIGVE